MLNDDDLPVLNDVVQSGDKAVIETSRHQHTEIDDQSLDQRIDRLIEKHMTALRVDIKIALLAQKSRD